MSAAGFQGRGSNPRGRKVRGIPSRLVGARIPQPNYNPLRREGHGIPISPGEYWPEHSPPMPWQQMNGIPPPQQYSNYESHRYRGGRPQFCSGISIRGRRGRIRGESDRERSRPAILPDLNYHPGVGLARTETDPLRFPPLGSEEERQKKIAETADKLKQKLSSLDIGEPAHFWEDDSVGVSFSNDNEEHGVATKGIPELRHDPPELNLTINDFKDIGRVDPDNCVNSGESAKALPSKGDASENTGVADPKNSLQSDKKKLKNSNEVVTEVLSNKKVVRHDEPGRGTSVGEQEASNSSRNDSGMGDEEETMKRDNRLLGAEKVDDERLKFPSRIEREALKVIERKKNSELKLQKLTKSLEKLREVIKVDKELEKKEGKSGLHNEGRTIFHADNMQPRLQPDVRLDFHSGIRPGYQRFQGFANTGGPQEMRNRFQGPFRPENPMEMQPNFPPDYQQRFDPGLRNFNIPRMIPPEYGGPMPPRTNNRNSDLQMGFDPREHPSRFSHPQRQDHPNNQSWFTRNELPQKYGAPDNINGLQPSPAFDPRGPPPRFLNQEQEINIFRPNIGPPSEFQQIMPMGYPPAQHLHMRHQSTYFNPPMPPLNTAPCIIPEFPQHSMPPSIKNQPTLQPPPIPTGALQLQPHIPLPHSSPPKDPSPEINEAPFSASQNHTPNMNEELEDMQEAMEFAKKLMNMAEEEEIAAHEFEMPIFPDLPPIPSTEPSHLPEKIPIVESLKESIQREEKESVITKDKQSPEPGPQIPLDEPIPKDLQSEEKEEIADNFSEDQLRAKVTFNLTTKTKMITQLHQEWRYQNSEGSSRDKRDKPSMDSSTISEIQEKRCDVKLRENRNNRKNKAQIKEDEKMKESKDSNSMGDDNVLQKENRVENVVESSGKIVDESTKGRPSGSKTGGKTLAASVVDANWKDKVINQFLKMSKNDICNMVNSSGLRKFDIAMKHLVKERKYSLSQERRCSADDAVKGGAYDMSREEFMSQLSAMLDPSATVDVNNLPSKFIQHLSEVLKLDVQSHLNDPADFIEQNDVSNNFDNVDSLQDDHNSHFISEPQSIADSPVNSNEHFERNVKMEVVLNQEVGLSTDYGKICTNIDNENNSSPNVETRDNIVSAEIGNTIEARETIPCRRTTDETSQEIEEEHVSLGLIRARCTKTLMSEENVATKDFFSAEIASPKQMEIGNSDSEMGAPATHEGGEGRRRRTRQDPDMVRNLSKEEWATKCAKSTESLNERDVETWSRTPLSKDTSLSARSRSPRSINKSSSHSHRSRHVSSPSLLKEKNCNMSIIVHTTNDAADKWSKATEDESLVEKSYNDLNSVGSTLIDSDRSTSPNVTKLLKVNKDHEKRTKDMSLNDTAMGEISTEMEYEKGRERRDEVDPKIQKREKNSGRRECKHALKLRRERETDCKVHEEIQTPITNERITHDVTFIKQEELIIEADSEPCFETTSDLVTLHETEKGNSQSTVDTNEETLSQISSQEHNEVLGPLEETLNTQEMLVAQEYENPLSLLDLKPEFSHDSHQSSVLGAENFQKVPEIESSPRPETPVRLFEAKETRNALNDAAESQLSKSGTKKIDIKVYKARKLQRNFGKRDKSKGIEATSDCLNIDATNTTNSSQEAQQESAKETQTENVLDDLGSNKSKQNPKPGSTKGSSIDSPDPRALIHHEEKIPAPGVKYDKKKHRREERKPSKERSTRSDKKRSRTHSRERGRSTSREERYRFSRQNSKHSWQDRHCSNHARSASLDKSRGKNTHHNNNIVGLKDRKTTRYGACDSPKELHDKIEKRHSRSRKKFAEEKTGDNETRRKNNGKEQSPASIRHGIATDERKSKKDHEMVKNRDLPKETKHVAEKHEEIISTDTLLAENSRITSAELDTSQKSPEAASNDVTTQDYVDPSTSQNQNTPSDHQEEPTPELTSETADSESRIQVDNSEENAAKESSSKENDLIQNGTEGSSLQDQEILELNNLIDTENELENEFQQNEANAESDLLETIENSVTHTTEATLKIMSELELEQLSENDIILSLNNLIDTVVSQLDLLSGKNEAKEVKAPGDIEASTELVSPSENEKEVQELKEDNVVDFNSPKTPESPLKGFSEESIETSIMGKQRLAQSVLEITEDYNTHDEKSKISDNNVLRTNNEDANVLTDHNDPIMKENSEKINSEPETINIVTAENITADVFQRELEVTIASEKGECVTPSGDTLSLGSPIDFGNGEFIVLSELSSDENFVHDGNRTLQISTIPETQELGDVQEPNVENASTAEEKGNEEEVDSSSESKTSTKKRESPSIKTQRNTEDTELLAINSELDTEVESLAKFSVVQDNAEQNCVPSIKDPETSVSATYPVETTEQPENSNNIVENEESHIEPSSKSTLKKSSVAEDDDPRSKISAHKKDCKTNEGKHINTSNENNTDKNLHGVKHRHRTKHKKNKKYKLNEKQIKEVLRDGDLITIVKKQQTKEGVMARMVEIDLEIHKLMSEKMKLYEMLESGELPNEQGLAVAKEGLEPVVEILNASRREPNPNCSNNESHAPQGNRKVSGSRNTAELSHSKSSKITASYTSEDDAGNRNSANQRNAGPGKKPKKIHKQERPLRSDNSVQTESLKSSANRPGDSKNSISRRKHKEDKSTRKKHNHSRSSSSSNRKREGEAPLRRDEQTRKNAGSVKEALDEDDKVSEKSKRADYSNEQKKKTNKVSETKEDSLRNMKKEAQISVSKDEIATCVTVEKYSPQIYSDESSQVSQVSQECKGTKKATRGLALLEETFKRERIASRKRRAVILKDKKEGPLKYLQKSVNFGAFSPSEEEMPLNLLYDKKRQRKKEPLNNAKSKRAKSAEIVDHVLETINAVAENKIEEYQRSDRVTVEMEETVDANKRNIIRKTKIRSKTKPINESQPVRSTEDAPGGKNLTENFSDDDSKDPGNLLNSKLTRSPHESDNKIMEISRSRSRTKSVGSRGDLQESSLLGSICGKEINEIIEDEETNWSNSDPLRLNLPEAHTFNYLDDIPQFDDSCSTFMPQDPRTHGHSISRNIKDIEKGLDVLDSMLETVSSDLEGISAKDVPPNLITKKTKRKRKGSNEDCDIPLKKKNEMTKSEMMNCSVRLVDCKYTYLKNQTTEKKKVNQKRKNSASSVRLQNVIELQEETTKLRSESPVLPQPTPSEESPDWLLREDRLIDEVENLPSLNDEDYLTPENNLGLNNMEINSEYDDDDLEIMKLNASSSNVTQEDIVGAFCPEATLSEVGNWQLLDKIQTDGFGSSECNAQITETIDCDGANSPRLSSGCPTTEIFDLEQPDELALNTKPFPELLDSEVDQEAQIGKPDGVLESEICIVEEETAVGKCGGDIEVPNSSGDQDTNEIQEIQFPRIQYSVHKGPILDLKVFGDSILAASEDGVIYRYSQTCNGILNTYEGHKSAVTCIHVLQGTNSPGTHKDWLFSGSLDGSLRCFDVMTSLQVRGAADVGSPIQCMDQSWGVIFLGTKSGYVFRFHIKTHGFKGDEIKFSEESVLALKATTEGPRRVLIVASRSQPITIRDAQSGLFLRTVSGHKSHTVYSLLMDSNLVYCGTSSTAIPVFDFINGSQVNLYNAGPGIVCMRIYKWLLFAGCYDGNIYVFDTKEQKLICSIPGPGNMLLSMDIVENKIVAGSKDRRLHIWQMPEQVLTLLAGRT